MGEATTAGDPYLFGHSDEETRRLLLQSRLFNPSTRRLLLEAGITAGMTVLDVGSGAGDVALLVADLVGPSGSVVGVDSNPRILDTARVRVAAAALPNVSFLSGDIAEIAFDRSFDAVVGRCVLFFLSDPVAALRKLVGWLRPGGIVAFQEPGNAAHRPAALPPSPLLDRMWDWILELYRRTGMDLHAGLHVFHHFREAGLPVPTMHLDAAVGGGPDWAGYDYMAGLVRTLLPLFVRHGIATEEEVAIETLAERLRQEVSSQQGVVTTWSFITAWARKP